jgi:hypothetical protein
MLREFPRGESLIGVFSDHLKFIYTKLCQNYIDGLDYDSHIPTCTSVDPPLRKNSQQNFFFFQNLVDIFFKGLEYPKQLFQNNFHLHYTLKIILPGSDPLETISNEKLLWCKLDPILNLLEIAK